MLGSVALKNHAGRGRAALPALLDSGLIVIPKTVTPERLQQNIDVFDFSLDAADMAKLAKLDSPDGRIGPDPMTATF